MDRTEACRLVFNSEKCDIYKSQISFFGNIYSAEGIKPDPEKVKAITQMPVPQSKEDLQKFLGIMTYIVSFIPNFSDKSHLRDLVKKDTPFVLHEDHINCFNELKAILSSEACLAYYDPKKPVTLEMDASQKGVGAALFQNNRPVAFASKTLDQTQSNYPNIDRQMLAIVLDITRFHTYLYGRHFKVVTDHKPLVDIVDKPLHKAPPRLQRMLYKIQGYDFQLTYKPGNTMVLSDTLSWLSDPKDEESIPLDVRVDGIEWTPEEIYFDDIDLINFTRKKQEEMQDETDRDHSLCLLKDAIIQGWPETIKEVPTEIRYYWSFRDELGVEMASYSKVLKWSFLHHCKKTSCHNYTKPSRDWKD